MNYIDETLETIANIRLYYATYIPFLMYLIINPIIFIFSDLIMQIDSIPLKAFLKDISPLIRIPIRSLTTIPIIIAFGL